MGAARQRQDVRKMNTSYVQRHDESQMIIRQRRKRKNRRLMVLLTAMVIFLSFVGSFMISQSKEIALREEKLLLAQKQYDELLKEEQNLQEEIIRLNDDEYIAKLARKEYFLTKEGEINFIIPDNNNN